MSMFLVSSLVCLAAVASFAQQPLRPVIPETFYGEYDAFMRYVDHFGAHEQYGRGWRAYDIVGNRGVRNSTFETGPEGKFESFYHLERYDMNTAYDVTGGGQLGRCTHYEVVGQMPSYWNWLEFADYGGMRTMPRPGGGEMKVDIWFLEVADEKYELGVNPEIPNQPAAYFRQSAREDWSLAEFYTAFQPYVNDETLFYIPVSCQREEQQPRPVVRQPLHRHR